MAEHQSDKLGDLLRSARGKTPRKKIERGLDLPPGTINQYESARLPPIGRLRSLCDLLGLDFGTCVAYLADAESDACTKRGIELMTSDYAAIPKTFNGFPLETLIMGDRRSRPPDTLADVLATHVSSGDLFFYRERLQIWHDKIIDMLPESSLKQVLPSGILTLGSPAVNLCSRVVNRVSAFRFFVPTNIDELEIKLRHEFAGTPRECLTKHADDLGRVIDGNRGQGFIDPFSKGETHQEPGPYQYGVLSLAPHPWDPAGIALLAGGQRGPATASVLKLLAEPDCFGERPLGGVFRVHVPETLGIAKRYPNLSPEWTTKPYSIIDYISAIADHEHCSSKWAEGIKRLIENIDRMLP